MDGSDRQTGFQLASVGTGFIAGILATIPMTVLMVVLHRFLKVQERYPLPPRVIMSRLLGGHLGIAATVEGVDATELQAMTLVSHFAYGGACGSLLAAIEHFVSLPRAVKGIVFGLVVWAASYMAWLPALGILPPATEQPPRRNAVMIASHIVWGVAAGLVLDLLDRPDAATGQPD